MTKVLWRRSRRRARGEGGTAIVEMAIVAPVLILLVVGAIEIGLAFRERHTISNAVNSAARSGATVGDDPSADWAILQAIEASFSGSLNPGIIDHVDIFQAGANGSKGNYDRYVYDGELVCAWNPCPAWGTAFFEGFGSPANWIPADRDTTLDPATGLDTLGVEIQFRHEWITGIVRGGQETWTERALVRLEPKLLGP